MLPIPDYVALLINVGDYGGRSDIAQMFPMLVGLAEAKLNGLLRVADMETVATIAMTTGAADLPDDFLEARQVLAPSGDAISAWSISALTERYRNFGGMPAGYAVIGNQIQARPTSDGNLTLIYYAAIPPLTADNPVNWLLRKGPDVYLYALLEEVAIWQKDAANAQAVSALKDQAIKRLNLNDERSRWGNGQFVFGGIAP